MTDAEINVAIAQACGWGTCPDNGTVFAKWKHYDTGRLAKTDADLPNFCGSLDQMAQAEATLRQGDLADYWKYGKKLDGIVCRYNSDEARDPKDCIGIFEASARQRAEAFISVKCPEEAR